MCFIVLPQSTVTRLCAAAQRLQEFLEDGTLAAAFGDGKPEQVTASITAFDKLAEATAALLDERKDVSPFLRFRQEIMGLYGTSEKLRGLVLNLWGGRQTNLGRLFMNADEHHTRIALECIASYTRFGENDRHFMELANEIRDEHTGEVTA